MTFDYDLSDFSVDQANLWIYLHADSVRTDILAGRAVARAFIRSRRRGLSVITARPSRVPPGSPAREAIH